MQQRENSYIERIRTTSVIITLVMVLIGVGVATEAFGSWWLPLFGITCALVPAPLIGAVRRLLMSPAEEEVLRRLARVPELDRLIAQVAIAEEHLEVVEQQRREVAKAISIESRSALSERNRNGGSTVWRSLRRRIIGRSIAVDREAYLALLVELLERSYRACLDEISVFYVIGGGADGDRSTIDYVTSAGHEEQPLRWRTFMVGVIGSNAPAMRSLDDLPEIRASQFLDGQQVDLMYLALGRENHLMRGVVLFEPEITAKSPRHWSLSYRYPGTWNPLRRDFVDEAAYTVHERTTCTRLSMTFVFPRNAVGPYAGGTNPLSESRPIFSIDADGRTAIAFEYDSPHTGRYTWQVSVAGFA